MMRARERGPEHLVTGAFSCEVREQLVKWFGGEGRIKMVACFLLVN